MSRIVFHLLLGSVMIASMYHLGYVCQQDDFWPLLGSYAIFFGAYALVIKTVNDPRQVQGYLALGIGLRLLLLFSVPNLSDDVYRYLWDGHLWLNGINPFVHPPSYYLQHPPLPAGLTVDLYSKLNSPDYHTIYPPVAQGLFTLSCALFPKNMYASIVVMKVVVVLSELGSLRLLSLLLRRNGSPAPHILLYALNPLIILELTGNLHLEGLMIFFLLLSLWLLSKNSYSWATLAIAGSVASKLLPLMFLPFFIRRWGWPKWSVQYFMLMGLALLLLFMPMLSLAFLRGFGSSLDLYFQRFEFNAGIYYLLRWVFMVLTGYNFILFLGPALSLFALYAIVKMAKAEVDLSWEKLPVVMLFAFSMYLSTATIIHPWYLALPVAICVLTPFRFPILWSGLVVLSYSHYDGGLFQENYWLIALEYLGLAGYLWIELVVIKRGRTSLGRPIIHEKTT
ncbi:hypothetical protein [Haliscomenobacter hydrossis]|uniref:Mannosyltransferase n=1 Tax=Haliscomenobacter hydrossis (strain ATCC 27775 / DSM 1100 / LMG 10767 / O) TaxID=760192 RepID=F4L1V2_HALH1|nr:hypothetical protein [Haliscomenobacter hydrossis]AEE49611.1 hypothetical protein Halhy_1722 [Haliscomenobacter hydrossis DSM 1100]